MDDIPNIELIDVGIQWMWKLYNPQSFKVSCPHKPPVLNEDIKQILRMVFMWNYSNVNLYEPRILKGLPLNLGSIRHRNLIFDKVKKCYNKDLVHFLRKCELYMRKHPRYKFK